MGTVRENVVQWSSYKWPEDGDEWSKPWGNSTAMWHGTIYPRIRAVGHVPHILEIAPGYGRCTQFMLRLCQQLTVVDLAENCIRSCQQRFAAHRHIDYHVNDGQSLDFLPDESVDFVFGWDSLVHAGAPVLERYLEQLSRKLKPGGFGMLHHSNMGTFRDARTGDPTAKSAHWRDPTMSAVLFRCFCRQWGLNCISQEVIAWEKDLLSDTISFFGRPANVARTAVAEKTAIFENFEFYREVANVRRINNMYAAAA